MGGNIRWHFIMCQRTFHVLFVQQRKDVTEIVSACIYACTLLTHALCLYNTY